MFLDDALIQSIATEMDRAKSLANKSWWLAVGHAAWRPGPVAIDLRPEYLPVWPKLVTALHGHELHVTVHLPVGWDR